MKKLTTSIASALAALGLALALSVPAQATAVEGGPEEAQCDAEFQPSKVTVQQKTVTVAAALSEQVKSVKEIAPAGESGLVVESFQHRKPSQQPDVVIRLDTSDANAGEWDVTISGESVTCEGTLTVRRPQEEPSS